MGIMNKDVMMIYSPTLLLSSPNPPSNPSSNEGSSNSSNPTGAYSSIDESHIAAATAADLAQSFTFWSAAADKTGLRPSRFIGTDSRMSFIAATHFRIYKDSPESEFAKVTYYVEPDSTPAGSDFKVEDSNRIVKLTSADVFENDDLKDREAEHKYTLLRGVTKCKFTYYRWEDNSFKAFNSWDSDQEDFKWQIPDVVQVDIEVKGPGGLDFTGTYRFKPELPYHGLNPSF
jgi:hypothetical protein